LVEVESEAQNDIPPGFPDSTCTFYVADELMVERAKDAFLRTVQAFQSV